MRNARAILAGILPVAPEASKYAVLRFVVTDRATEMTADVADRHDLSFIFVQENVVVIDPAGELASLLQLVNGSEVLIGGLSTLVPNNDWFCSG